jgi:regulator of nucleoside diphosphate kinase
MNTAASAHDARAARHSRTLTELDHARLCRLIERSPETRHAALADALVHSSLVPAPEVDPDVVTMYTRVLVEDTTRLSQHVYTLCYPADAEPAEGFISVLSPVGAALLGARVGELVRFTRPDGGSTGLVLRRILFQPEATGHYTM